MQSVMREDAFALQVGNEFRVLPSRQAKAHAPLQPQPRDSGSTALESFGSRLNFSAVAMGIPGFNSVGAATGFVRKGRSALAQRWPDRAAIGQFHCDAI
jgi:hypothetical protein